MSECGVKLLQINLRETHEKIIAWGLAKTSALYNKSKREREREERVEAQRLEASPLSPTTS